jgi:hypothetical protein
MKHLLVTDVRLVGQLVEEAYEGKQLPQNKPSSEVDH